MSALYIIMNFNPRAPCGARPHWMTFVAAAALFQSTRPMQGATRESHDRVSRDDSFNPRAPCGARRVRGPIGLVLTRFQSTRPVWGATSIVLVLRARHKVSIHAPRVGRDLISRIRDRGGLSFNPRAPCGARRQSASQPLKPHCFNPRAPCGARLILRPTLRDGYMFQSTRPMRGAT